MENINIISVSFLIVILLNSVFACFYGQKTKVFKWREYFAILICPLLFIVALAYFVDIKILSMFLISSFVGFAMEYGAGLVYHKTLNRRLWTYGRLSLHGYTSPLSIPLWGIVGVGFWLISKMIGL